MEGFTDIERRTPAFAPKPASFFSRAHPLPAGARDFNTQGGHLVAIRLIDLNRSVENADWVRD
jgi:hypothetical protein